MNRKLRQFWRFLQAFFFSHLQPNSAGFFTGKQLSVYFLVALSLCTSGVLAAYEPFRLQWHPELPPPGDPEATPSVPTYLASDIVASPQLSVSSNNICSGSNAVVTFTSSSNWNTATALSAGSADGTVNRTTLITSYAQDTGPYAVQWIQSAKSDLLYNQTVGNTHRLFQITPAPNKWTQFLNDNGLQGAYRQYTIGSYYQCPNLIEHYFSQTSGGVGCSPPPNPAHYTKYKAYAALLCNAKVKISVSGGPSYSSDDYLDSPISKTVSGLSLGTHTITSSLDVQRCMAALVEDGTHIYKAVAVTINDTFKPSFSAPIQTITVSDPFVCSIASSGGTATPNPVAPGNQADFSFTFHNNGNAEITVTSIALPANPVFSNLRNLNPALPFAVPAGGSRTVGGTADVAITAPSGQHSLNLSIASQTAQPDCTNSIQQCNAPSLAAVQVSIGTAQAPNYVPEISAPTNAQVGVPFNATITTRNAGSANAPAVSKTQINFTGLAPVLIDVPALNAGAGSPSTQAFACTSQGEVTISALADALGNISESNEGDNFASATVSCGPSPFGNLTIACSVEDPVLFPPDSTSAYANCFNSSMQPTNCPALNWSENFPSASLALQQTPANGPTVANTLNAPAPVTQLESGTISIICADGSQCTASCNANLTLSPPPTSMVCNFLNHSNLFSPNDWAFAQANCTGALGQPTACYRQMWLTNIAGGSLAPPITPPNISPQSNFSTNNAPVPQTGGVLAVSMNENGGFIVPFITALCNASVDNVGPNYVIDTISASGDSSIGGTFQVDVRVRNNGNQNATVDSQTMLLGQNCTIADQFESTSALDAGEASPIFEFDCTCSSPGLQTVRAMADATFLIDETSEDDNWASIGFFCQQTFIPQCFDYY